MQTYEGRGVVLDDYEVLLKGRALRSYRVELVSLTPVFMHGWQRLVPDRNRREAEYAELRESSIKGVLRYWWRALNMDDPHEMLRRETELFGGTGVGDEGAKKSPISLYIEARQRRHDNTREPLRPHKSEQRDRLMVKAIPSNTPFALEVSAPERAAAAFKEVCLYLEFMLMVSGFGQRARRGGGAVQRRGHIYSSPKDYVEQVRELLGAMGKRDDFTFFPAEGRLYRRNIPRANYPLLIGVYIGNPYANAEEARRAITGAASRHNPPSNRQYLGKVHGGRLASPLHCTVRQFGDGFRPVVSEVWNLHYGRDEYIEARNRFLPDLGVMV